MKVKEQNTIKSIVKNLFGYNLEEVVFDGDKLKIVVEGKAYGDGYSSYVRAKYNNGVWQESQIGCCSDMSSINMVEKKLGVENLKRISVIELIENYD